MVTAASRLSVASPSCVTQPKHNVRVTEFHAKARLTRIPSRCSKPKHGTYSEIRGKIQFSFRTTTVNIEVRPPNLSRNALMVVNAPTCALSQSTRSQLHYDIKQSQCLFRSPYSLSITLFQPLHYSLRPIPPLKRATFRNVPIQLYHIQQLFTQSDSRYMPAHTL